MGAGAVGSYFGSKLALAGHEVYFVARGEHLRAMRENGLVVRTLTAEWRVDTLAIEDPHVAGPVDLVLSCVKGYDLDSAALALGPLIGPNTLVIPLQNGVDAPLHLQQLYGDCALGGSCHIEAYVAEPGLVMHTSSFAYLTFGELDQPSLRAERLRGIFEDAGINVKLSTDIWRSLWEKFIYLTTLSGITTITQLPIGPVREQGESWAMLKRMVYEVTRVGRADGVNLPHDQEDRTLERFRTLHTGMKSSMLRDRERGRRLEVESIQGAVIRRARRLGISVPVTETVYALLRPLVGGGASYNQARAQLVAAAAEE